MTQATTRETSTAEESQPCIEAGQKRMLNRAVRLGQLVIGILFLYASIGKLGRPYQFLESVLRYQIVYGKAALVIAMFVPHMELLLGVCLVAGILTRGSLLAAWGLLTVFLVAQIAALSRGLPIACGCIGGIDSEPINLWTVSRTFLLWGIAAGLVIKGQYCAKRVGNALHNV